jgi:UDP-N-acetylglucosamine 2-epimerase (non-hydrolysing)
MTIAPETSVRILTRHFSGAATVGKDVPGAGAVVYPVGSRSEAVRLATIVDAVHAAGVPQTIARLVGGTDADGDVFDGARIPRTESLVDVRPGTEVQRTANALAAAEQLLVAAPPSLVVLGGDAEASLAFALAAAKLGVPIARVGAGLRCGDFSLTEEVNRTLTDRLADLLFTDTVEASDALESEGIVTGRVHHVGNTIADLALRWKQEAGRRAAWRSLRVEPRGYVLVTLHRPENIADDVRLARIVEALVTLSRRTPVVLPLHPRTRARMEPMGDLSRLLAAGVYVTEPLAYLDFLSLEQSARAILTDSGGVQDEASALDVPCFTLRRATERVGTLTHGSNVLLGDDPDEIGDLPFDAAFTGPTSIPLWDGRAGERIAARVTNHVHTSSSSL